MVTMAQIEELGRRIAEEFQPQRIVLFGSYARGQATPDSDVDLLIITPIEKRPADKAVQIMLKVRPAFPVDLIVRTPEKVRERLAIDDGFMREILEQGITLYETNHEGMGRKS